MIENNLITVIGNKILQYPNEIGARHLDKLQEACKDLNLSTGKNNELEVALFLATNNYIVISNLYGGLLFSIPENLSDFQIDYLMSQKEKLYEMISNGNIIEISIASDKLVDYNKSNYRDLGIEQQIANYEGKKIDSQLDILYEEVENQKNHLK